MTDTAIAYLIAVPLLVVAALSGVSIRVAPPSDSLQPFILSIGARPPDQTGDCSG